MKKIFIAMMAMAAMAACATEDTIVTPQGDAIAFGDAFVDNSTKAIYEKADDIKGFTVFGNVVATDSVNTPAPLYGDTGATVTRGTAALGAAWKCDVTRYWIPSCTFNFAAIANHDGVTVVNGIPTKIKYTVANDDNNDLIYGVASAETDESGVPTEGVSTNGVVAFTMNHLLAKMYFTVTDNMGDDYTVTPTSIKVTQVEKSGTYDIAEKEWTPGGDKTAELEFVGGAQLIIPVEQELAVEITYNVEFGGTTLSTGAKKTGTITTYTYKANTVYNITATIGATAIQFSIDSVDGFGSPEQGGTVTIQ